MPSSSPLAAWRREPIALLLALLAACAAWPARAVAAGAAAGNAEVHPRAALMRRSSDRKLPGVGQRVELALDEEEADDAEDLEEEKEDEEYMSGFRAASAAAAAGTAAQAPFAAGQGLYVAPKAPSAPGNFTPYAPPSVQQQAVVTGILGFVETTTTDTVVTTTTQPATTTTVLCVDKLRLDAPLITINGQERDCTELRRFCEGHPESEYVARKCPLTCEACKATPTTTTIVGDSTDKSCSRRRRWGFCYTRRRRNE